MTEPPTTLIVCINRRFHGERGSCAEKGSEALAAALEKGIAERGIDIEVETLRCLGTCDRGPSMRLAPGGKFYFRVQPADVPGILDEIEGLCGRRQAKKKREDPPVWPGT